MKIKLANWAQSEFDSAKKEVRSAWAEFAEVVLWRLLALALASVYILALGKALSEWPFNGQ
jgi:hypothetical protein